MEIGRGNGNISTFKWLAGVIVLTMLAAMWPPALGGTSTAYAYGSSLPAPESAVMTEAYNSINYSIPNFFANANGGSEPELKRAEALFTIARAYVAGGITNIQHLDKMVDWVKLTLTNSSNMPDMHAGIDMRQQQYYLLTLSLIWHTPGLKSKFTTAEQNAMLTMARAAVASTAYVTADYNAAGSLRAANTRITMDLDSNCWPQGNPNWTEAVLGSFMAGAYIMGLSNVSSFLTNYSHATFKTELTNRGLTNVYNTFNMTANATIESYVKNIVGNDNAGKPFFRSMKLSWFVSDPFNFYYEAVGKHTFNQIATEGDYVGQLGRAKEFNSDDGGGLRDSLGYVKHGVNHTLGNVYLLDFMGSWSGTSETVKRAEMEQRMRVGFSDLLGKAYNGYWSRQNGGTSHHIYQPGSYYTFGQSLAQAFGFTRKVLFNANFDSSSYSGWSRTNTAAAWPGVTSVQTWSGSTTSLDPVLQMSSTVSNSGLVAPYSGNDYIVYSPIKVDSWAASDNRHVGIIGKYVDSSNYYLMRYNQSAGKLQIVKVKNGNEQVLSEAAFTWVLGTVYQVKGVFGSNGKLDFHIWGGSLPKVTATDTEFASGKAGYYGSLANVKFDDFLITNRQ